MKKSYNNFETKCNISYIEISTKKGGIMTKLSFFCIIFLLTVSSFAGAYWVSLDGSSERSPEVNVVYSNNAETVLEFRIFGFNVEETSHNGKTYHRISIPDVGGKTEETGKPELPLLTRPVGIPDNAEVSLMFWILNQRIQQVS